MAAAEPSFRSDVLPRANRMDGPVKRKHDKSSTPFYFHLKSLVGY